MSKDARLVVVVAVVLMLISGGDAISEVVDGGPITLAEGVIRADFVAEADLAAIYPPLANGPVEVLVNVRSVLKGPATTERIVVTIDSIDGILDMRLGQRYILFAQTMRPKILALLPDRPSLPHYEMWAGALGPFKVDGNRVSVTLPGASPMWKEYERSSRLQILSEITAIQKDR